jgi:hypothetical protein
MRQSLDMTYPHYDRTTILKIKLPNGVTGLSPHFNVHKSAAINMSATLQNIFS